MRAARDAEDFAADPIGRFTVGTAHLVWCHSATLCGSVHWGRPTEDDARTLVRALELSMHPALAGGFDVLLDSSPIEAFDFPAYAVVVEYVMGRLPEWARLIRHQAAVLPSGPLGFTLAGMVPALGGSPFPQRFFASRMEAIGWLARPELGEVLQEVDERVDGARGLSPLVRRLRDALERQLDGASLEGAAHTLGTTSRSLQRELMRTGTSFSAELMGARVRAACAMLVHSDEKVESIARRVGCSSSSQLSALLRRSTGETPAQFRSRHRGA